MFTSTFTAKGKAKSLDFSRMIGKSLGIERKVTDPFSEKRQWQLLDDYAQASIEADQKIKVSKNY